MINYVSTFLLSVINLLISWMKGSEMRIENSEISMFVMYCGVKKDELLLHV